MKFIIALTLAFPLLASAQGRPELESQLTSELREVNLAIKENLQFMDENEILEATRSLRSIKRLARGRGQGPGRDRPIPQGPTNPYPREIPCSQDYRFQETFVKIKAFAYSGDGYNYSSSGATSYATNWTNTYSCDLADKYISDFKRIRSFAYSGSGLNLSSSGAVSYAASMISKLCQGVNFEQIYQRDYNFAYSGSGLNMSSSGARAYAQPRMEAQAFVCRNF